MTTEEILAGSSRLLTFEVRLYWTVAILYGVTTVLFLLHGLLGAGRLGGAGRVGNLLLWTTVALHLVLIGLRTYEGGRAPFQSLYETLSWFAASATITYLYVSRRWRSVHLPGAFVTTLAMGACLMALIKRTPALNPLFPALQSYWYEWHVVLAFFSYAVIIVSSAVEITYLMAKPLLEKDAKWAFGLTKDTIEGFRKTTHKLVLFGFPFLTFTLFSGALWANEAWGRYWGWDPKETWALITWTVFAMYLHAMSVPTWRGAPASTLNIIGFICMIMTFIGINWLAKLFNIPSLHLYAV